MTYYLFLDDIRHPHHVKWVSLPDVDWVIVRDYKQFVSAVETRGLPRFVSFDHDLADYHYGVMMLETAHRESGNTQPFDADYGAEKTGFHCAKWLVGYCLDNALLFPSYEVHSLNPVGTERIHSYINNARKVAGV